MGNTNSSILCSKSAIEMVALLSSLSHSEGILGNIAQPLSPNPEYQGQCHPVLISRCSVSRAFLPQSPQVKKCWQISLEQQSILDLCCLGDDTGKLVLG